MSCSSSSRFGIEVSGTGSNLIEGNLIGTAADGLSALGNAFDGVLILNASGGNTVGGTVAGAGNVISGNLGGYGVSYQPSSEPVGLGQHHRARLERYEHVLANAFSGVVVQSGGLASPASNNIIGGTTAFRARQHPSRATRECHGVDLFQGRARLQDARRRELHQGPTVLVPVARGSTLDGVYMDAGAFNNTIGGTTTRRMASSPAPPPTAS